MRTKVTLVLLLLNVALFFFIFKFERTWRTEDALREARRRVLGSETADIRALSVVGTVPGSPSYSLVYNRDIWLLTAPLDWPANPAAVDRIVHELQFLENETSFSVADLARSGQSLADYGLDKPRMTVTFSSSEGSATGSGGLAAGPTTVLRIGDSTKVGNRLYVLSPDGTRIHVVSRSLLDALSLPMDQLRADTLFTIRVYEARALSVQTSGARVRIRRDGPKWLFDTIVNARASKARMDLTINDLDALHARSFPTSRPTILPSTTPSLRVAIDGNNRAETLLLGDPVAGPAPAGAPNGEVDKETEYFAQLMNGNSVRAPVFTVRVPNDLIEHLRKAQDFLRERKIVDFDPAAVAAVTLTAPNQPAVTLQRLDPNATDSAWQLSRRGDNAANPQTTAADAFAVKQLLDRLAMLSAERFESDAPSLPQLESWGFNRPEREITIAVSGPPGASVAPIQVQLGTDGAGAVYARVGTPNEPGSSIYAVAVDLARDFPVTPTAWRDRTLRALPATARIVGLKITDLSDHHVIYETAIDSAGHPSVEPHDPAALPQILAGLRTLRAKRFVQDGFADRLILAGDERAWRYQIDATIGLPAGAGGEQTSTSSLFLMERTGGAQQVAGSKEFNAVFELEQPMLDALWSITYGARDPGPQLEKK